MPNNVTDKERFLEYIRLFNQVVLTADDIHTVISTLKAVQLKSGMATNLKHRNHVKALVAQDDTEKQCPDCGSAMVTRKTKHGKHRGQLFWGCSTFPTCKTMVKLS